LNLQKPVQEKGRGEGKGGVNSLGKRKKRAGLEDKFMESWAQKMMKG